MFCVGLVKTQIKPDDDFICKKCKKQNTIKVDMSSATTTAAAATTTKMEIDTNKATAADMAKETTGMLEEVQGASGTATNRKSSARKNSAGGSGNYSGTGTIKGSLKKDTVKDVDVESSEKEAEAKEVKTKFELAKHQCISPTTSSSKPIVTTKAADSSTNPNKEDDDDDTQDSVDDGVVGFDALGSPVQNRGSEQVTTTSVFQSSSDIDIRKRIEDLRRLQ